MNINDPLDRDKEEAEEGESKDIAPGFPDVDDCFHGFYAEFVPTGDGAQKTVSGADSYIGNTLELEYRGSGKEKHLVLVAKNGVSLGPVPHRVNLRLERLLDAGWDVTVMFSLITYSQDDKKFFAEVAFMCLNPDQPDNVHEALEEYVRQQTKRLKGGDHPLLSLTQKEFEKVVSTNGEWCLTAGAPLTKKQKNRMKYRNRQSFSEKLIDMSADHNIGCSIASVVFMALLFLIAGVIIWAIFFR